MTHNLNQNSREDKTKSIKNTNNINSGISETLKDVPGKVYKRPLEVRLKISAAHKGKPKLYTSWLKGRKGPAHPCYKHGKGKTREYDNATHAAWKRSVLKNYDYNCYVTGANTKLCIHHLEAVCICRERFYDTNNAVPLRVDIHKKFHAMYGTATTTAMFEEFLRKEFSWTKDFPWRQGNHEPSASLEDLVLKQQEITLQKQVLFRELVESRGHIWESGEYVNSKSTISIYCKTHNISCETTVTNYKKCKTGLKCCGQQKQSDIAKASVRDEKGRFKNNISS